MKIKFKNQRKPSVLKNKKFLETSTFTSMKFLTIKIFEIQEIKNFLSD
jgi:hypothetical protein